MHHCAYTCAVYLQPGCTVGNPSSETPEVCGEGDGCLEGWLIWMQGRGHGFWREKYIENVGVTWVVRTGVCDACEMHVSARIYEVEMKTACGAWVKGVGSGEMGTLIWRLGSRRSVR